MSPQERAENQLLSRRKLSRPLIQSTNDPANGEVVPLRPGSNDEEPEKLARDKIEAYLTRYGTNAETLLAAFQVGNDPDYLRMAATNFPGDSAVQYYVATLNLYPEQKREWLERFKASSPENSLAGYLSASDHLRNGQRDLALQDFAAAANKIGFTDYSFESMQQSEDILLASGKSPVEAKAGGMTGVLLPALAELKSLSRGMADLMKEYKAVGNGETATALAEMNYRLGERLSTGDGGRFMIHQLVGYAMERITLSELEPNGQYEFLPNTTPAQRLEQLQVERARVRELTKEIPSALSESDYSNPESISYFDRIKIYGERAALEWLQARRQQAPITP